MRQLIVFLLSSFIACAGLGRTMAAAETFKVAGSSSTPSSSSARENYPAMEAAVRRAVRNDVKLILFPEMSTTGYLYGSRAEIAPFVETIPGKTTGFFEKLAKDLDVYIVVGMPEVDADTGLYYNAAFLVGPQGLIGDTTLGRLPRVGQVRGCRLRVCDRHSPMTAR